MNTATFEFTFSQILAEFIFRFLFLFIYFFTGGASRFGFSLSFERQTKYVWLLLTFQRNIINDKPLIKNLAHSAIIIFTFFLAICNAFKNKNKNLLREHYAKYKTFIHSHAL